MMTYWRHAAQDWRSRSFCWRFDLRTGHIGQPSTTALGAMGYGVPSAIGAALVPESGAPSALTAMEGCKSTFREWRRFGASISRSSCSFCRMTGMRQSVHHRSARSAESSVRMARAASLSAAQKLALAYDLPYVLINGQEELGPQLKRVFSLDGPVLCEIPSPPDNRVNQFK